MHREKKFGRRSGMTTLTDNGPLHLLKAHEQKQIGSQEVKSFFLTAKTEAWYR